MFLPPPHFNVFIRYEHLIMHGQKIVNFNVLGTKQAYAAVCLITPGIYHTSIYSAVLR